MLVVESAASAVAVSRIVEFYGRTVPGYGRTTNFITNDQKKNEKAKTPDFPAMSFAMRSVLSSLGVLTTTEVDFYRPHTHALTRAARLGPCCTRRVRVRAASVSHRSRVRVPARRSRVKRGGKPGQPSRGRGVCGSSSHRLALAVLRQSARAKTQCLSLAQAGWL